MMNSAESPAILVSGLRIKRGPYVVIPDLDLSVSRGRMVGLLGPSGSGKTTLMRAIVGSQLIQEGTVSVLGKPAGSAPLRAKVGYVTQSPSIYTDLSARANLDYFAKIVGASSDRVQVAIEHVGLQDAADQRVENMSGGQRSRVSLAVALLGEPDLLVLDEPTVGLDPVLRRDLWQLFSRLAKEGTTILVSSHVMDEATHCDRLILLREGQVLADDTLAGLLERTGAADAEGAFLALVKEDV